MKKNTHYEIEKKFKIKNMPDLTNCRRKNIQQGYLCVNPVIRIRKSDDKYYLTYKSASNSKEDNILINIEEEFPLTVEAYEHLKEKTDGNLIDKTRYFYKIDDRHQAEIDIFHGVYEGLAFAEVEFESKEDAESFIVPEWLGENISGDKRYTNAFLSQNKNFSCFI